MQVKRWEKPCLSANPMIAKCYNAWKDVFHLTVKSQHDQVLLNYLSALDCILDT